MFLSVAPWAIQESVEYRPVHAGFTLLLWLQYAVLGAASGVAAAALLPLVHELPNRSGPSRAEPIEAARWLRSAGTMSAAAAFAAVIAVHLGVSLESGALLAACGVVVVAGLRQVWTGDPRRRLDFLTDPWTAAAVWLGYPSLAFDWLVTSAPAARFGWGGAWVAGVLGASWALHRRSAVAPPRTLPGWRTLVLTAAVVLVASSVLGQRPRVTPQLGTAEVADRPGPDVVVIVMDTVRADHLSVYGYERDTSPHLRQLAAGADLYTRAVATSDMTLATHASLFTGLYPRRHGAHFDPPASPMGRPLADGYDTLAERLAARGYRTAGVVSNFGFVGRAFGMDQGFGYYDQRVPVSWLGETRPYTLRQALRNVWVRILPSPEWELVYRRAGEINDVVLPLVEELAADPRPFLLFVNYMDAHWPYVPPPPFDTRFPGKGDAFGPSQRHALHEGVLLRERTPTEAERAHMVSQYDGGIAYVDDAIGAVVDRLDQAGRLDGALVVVTSDHGEAFGERDLIEHGTSVYQDQVHVPLLVKRPGRRAARTIDEPVSVVDVLPTVLDAAGAELSEDLDGRSLLAGSRARPVVAESYPSGWLASLHPRFQRVERAFYLGAQKLVVSTAGKRELYDLDRDPNERTDLYRDDAVPGLERMAESWLEGSKEAVDPGSSEELDPEILRNLEALGYAE